MKICKGLIRKFMEMIYEHVSSNALPTVVIAVVFWRIEKCNKSTRENLMMMNGDEDMGDMIASKSEKIFRQSIL